MASSSESTTFVMSQEMVIRDKKHGPSYRLLVPLGTIKMKGTHNDPPQDLLIFLEDLILKANVVYTDDPCLLIVWRSKVSQLKKIFPDFTFKYNSDKEGMYLNLSERTGHPNSCFIGGIYEVTKGHLIRSKISPNYQEVKLPRK